MTGCKLFDPRSVAASNRRPGIGSAHFAWIRGPVV